MSDPKFGLGKFARLVTDAGLEGLLQGPGPVSVWAPNDVWLEDLAKVWGTPTETVFADKELLRKVISYMIVPEVIPPEPLMQKKFQELTTLEGSKMSFLTVQRNPMIYNITHLYPGGFVKFTTSECFSNGFLHRTLGALWPPDVDHLQFERCPDVPTCGCRPKNDEGDKFYCKLVKDSDIGMVDMMRVTPGLTDLSPECSPVRLLKHEAGTEKCTFTEVELAVAEGQENVSSGRVTEEQLAN